MLFETTTFVAALLATLAVASPAQSVADRDIKVCGQYYDKYLGPSTEYAIFGGNADAGKNGACQQFKKGGENPNEQGVYVLSLSNPTCNYCNLFRDEDCNDFWLQVVKHDNDHYESDIHRSDAKSFQC